MFDHVEYNVSGYAAARHFYQACLRTLGWQLIRQDPDAGILGFSPDRFIRLHLTAGRMVGPALHIAFMARTRDEVDAFHAAGLAGGGRDNGAAGHRDYGTSYYAAFLLDPDGHNIEAVFRGAE
jgi:catechol 2,3-dioxygenase-like lactoylglutathione lyase family enzyme